MYESIIMDNGFLIVTPITKSKAGFLFVPIQVSDNINKGIVVKLDPKTQFKEGDLVTFHKTEGEKIGDKILLHEAQTFGYERK